MGCGAAAYNAAVTARASGVECTVDVTDATQDPYLVATLTLGRPIVPSDGDVAEARALALRHTMRGVFDPGAVPDDAVSRLRKATEAQHAWLYVLQREEDIVELAVLTSRAEAEELTELDYRAELAEWLRQPGEPAPDGIPVSALPDATERGSDVPLRSFTSLPALSGEFPPLVEQPLLVVIGTDGDRPVDWVYAGMAMQSLWLTATSLGLAASPMTQALDRPGSRAQLRHLVGVANGHPQIALRIGYGTPEPTTGRRPIEDTVGRTPVTAGGVA